MPTLNTNMTEMKAAKVERISLVSKAASRIPFRVIKEDRTMQNPLKTLDLATVFKGKKPDPVPTLVGIVTMKGDTLAAVTEVVKKAGFKVDAVVENDDGSVVFKQGEVAEGEQIVVIKMSDEVAITLKGFNPYNMQMDTEAGSSFSDMCSAQGFYPDVSTMMDVLQSSVMQAAYKADDPKVAAESVAKMFDEAKAYAVSLLTALPAAAFKMESVAKGGAANANGSMATANPPVVTTDTNTSSLGGATQKDPLAGAAPGTEGAASGTGDGSGVAKKGEGEGAAVIKAAKPDAEDLTDGGADEDTEDANGKKKTKKSDEAAADEKITALKDEVTNLLSEGLKQITASLTQAVGTVKKSVDEVSSQVQSLTTQVVQVEGVAKAAEQAVKGTVLGSDAGADATSQTQKSEQGGYRGREIDTGFTPRRRPAR